MIDLRLGDCLEVMKTIEDNSIDAIITDPPYGTTACKWDSVIDFDLMWEQLNRIIKPNGAIVLFGSEPFSSALRMSNIKNYKYDWVWRKTTSGTFQLAKVMPHLKHEIISVFINGKNFYYPQMITKDYQRDYKKEIPEGGAKHKGGAFKIANNKRAYSKDFNYKLKYPERVIDFSNKFQKSSGNHFHPTQKPTELMEYLIKTYTKENETVLDFTMGSGTTMVACRNLNRQGIGIEKEEKYFKIAQERINSTLF